MGSLKGIAEGKSNIVLLQTSSGKADIYVYDTLKKYCSATVESVYEIENKKTFLEMVELSSMQPYLSDKWLFVINYNKQTKGLCKTYKSVFNSDVSCFLIKVKNYKDFKEVKTLFPTCNDLYLSVIRKPEVMFILNGLSLSQKVIDFVANTYSMDVDKIFDLREKITQGSEVEKPRDVVRIIGSSGGTVSKFAISLLSNPPTTEKGFKQVLHNRLQTAKDLIDTYDVRSLRNFLNATVKDILDIKTLYTQGIIFKTIRNIPDCYDEKRLSKCNYCLERIATQIPMSRIVRLYCLIQEEKVWSTEKDVLDFIYKYYGGVYNGNISRL